MSEIFLSYAREDRDVAERFLDSSQRRTFDFERHVGNDRLQRGSE
jgi:hypothetical protein